MENEIWKPIPSIPGACASSLGRVWMPSKKNVLMPTGGTRDYISRPITGSMEKTASSRNEKKRFIYRWSGKTYKVHRLVCEAFHGPQPPDKPIVMHLDEDPTNNRPENLKWGTRKENQNFPKAKAAWARRVGDQSPWAIYQRRKQNDPNYKSKSGKT